MSKSGATNTDEAEASTKIVDTNQVILSVPDAETAWAKSQTRSCEGMLLKPHKPKLLELLRYYLK